MLRIRVDRVPKKDQLDERDARHHAKSQPVPPHLHKLLDDDRPETRRGKCTSRSFHDVTASGDPSMRWMKTSSSPASTWRHWYFSVRKGAIAFSRARASSPLTWSALPNGTACCTPACFWSRSASSSKSGPVTDHVVRCDCAI